MAGFFFPGFGVVFIFLMYVCIIMFLGVPVFRFFVSVVVAVIVAAIVSVPMSMTVSVTVAVVVSVAVAVVATVVDIDDYMILVSITLLGTVCTVS